METLQSPPLTSTQALEPFDRYEFADVILRSSDNCDFHVHKLVLSLSSPFFKQMFSLSQPIIPSPPPSPTPSPTHDNLLPVVPVSEDRATIDYLLRLCYPITDPTPPTDVATVVKVLQAAMKYELKESIEILRILLSRFVPAEPLKVYAHACQLRLENEACKAAKYWRDHNDPGMDPRECQNANHLKDTLTIKPCDDPNCIFQSFEKTGMGSIWVEEMKEMSAGCLYRLLHFVRTGESAGFCAPPVPPFEPILRSTSASSVDTGILQSFPHDMVLRSPDMELIPTHQIFLASAGAAELVESARNATQSPDSGGLPVVDMMTDKATILNLLTICQPFSAIPNTTLPLLDLSRVWDVARTHKMTKVMEAIKLSWTSRIEAAPITAYCAAMLHHWHEEARDAAVKSMKLHLFDRGGYTPEFELIPASTLHILYQFQHDHRKATATAFGQSWFNTHPWPATLGIDPSASLPLILAPVLSQSLFKKVKHPNKSTCCISQHWDQEKERKLIEKTKTLQRNSRVAAHDVQLKLSSEPIAPVGSVAEP